MSLREQSLETPHLRAVLLAGGVALALAALVSIRSPMAALALAAAAVAIVMLWASRHARRNAQSLLFALFLIEALPSVNLIGESIRPFIRYSLLLLFAGPALLKAVRTQILARGGFRLYSLYFAFAAFSLTYSIAPLYSMGRLLGSVLVFGALCAIASEVENDAEVHELFGAAWGACAVMVALLGVAMLVVPRELAWPSDQFGLGMPRFAGIFGSPNQVGELTLATVAAGLLYWPWATGNMRALVAITLIASVCFGVMADSRSAFVGLALGVGIAAVRAWGWRGVLAASILMLIGIAAVAFSNDEVRDYFLRGELGTLTGRTEVWSYVAGQIAEHPILGYGFGTEGQIFQSRYFPLWGELWNAGPRSSIHSGYLARAAGLGIPATVLWMFLIARPFAAMLRARRPAFDLKNATLIAAIPILILTLVESTGGDCRDSVGLLLTLVWCLAERSRLSAQASRAPSDATAAEWQMRTFAHGG